MVVPTSIICSPPPGAWDKATVEVPICKVPAHTSFHLFDELPKLYVRLLAGIMFCIVEVVPPTVKLPAMLAVLEA